MCAQRVPENTFQNHSKSEKYSSARENNTVKAKSYTLHWCGPKKDVST
jgi:hypothetical protein